MANSLIDNHSLHDALPISPTINRLGGRTEIPKLTMESTAPVASATAANAPAKMKINARKIILLRSEEHTSELQSRFDLVCRLLLEKKNNTHNYYLTICKYI